MEVPALVVFNPQAIFAKIAPTTTPVQAVTQDSPYQDQVASAQTENTGQGHPACPVASHAPSV